MKDQLKVPAIIVAVVALAALIFFLGSRAMTAGNLDQGQVKYTPGVPPWQEKDPAKQGPGGPPPTAQSGGPPNGALPPGMSAPLVDNRNK